MDEKTETTRVDGKSVDRVVGDAFKTYVLNKHGKIRGVLSDEITKALTVYLQEAAKKEENDKAAEERRFNIASWGMRRDGDILERVYAAVKDKLIYDGVIYRHNSEDIAVTDPETGASSIMLAIRDFLNAERYFEMLCHRHNLIVLDDGSVIGATALKEKFPSE